MAATASSLLASLHGGRERSSTGRRTAMPASLLQMGLQTRNVGRGSATPSGRPFLGGAAAAGSPGSPAPTAAPDPAAYDFGDDPILQKIQAITAQERQNATTNALAARKQLAIEYGDTAGILEGDQYDQATADAAHNNPFSILAELQRGYDRGNHTIDENLNKENLFYSGEHAKQLGLAAEELQRQRAEAAGNVQKQVGTIQGALAAALMGANQEDAQGYADAEARAQQRATQYGYDPGAGSGPASGGSGFLGGGKFASAGYTSGKPYAPPPATPTAPPPSSSSLLRALASAGARNRGRY